jgi:hypothetical protein
MPAIWTLRWMLVTFHCPLPTRYSARSENPSPSKSLFRSALRSTMWSYRTGVYREALSALHRLSTVSRLPVCS